MFGKLGEIGGMMKQMGEMKARMKEMQEKVGTMRFEADAGAGAVKVVVNGRLELSDVKISPEAYASGDREMLEDLIKAATAAAQKKAAEGVRVEMQKVTGGMNLPGLDSLLGG